MGSNPATPTDHLYQISINGSGLSSGTYLYKVTGANFIETRAVTLLK